MLPPQHHQTKSRLLNLLCLGQSCHESHRHVSLEPTRSRRCGSGCLVLSNGSCSATSAGCLGRSCRCGGCHEEGADAPSLAIGILLTLLSCSIALRTSGRTFSRGVGLQLTRARNVDASSLAADICRTTCTITYISGYRFRDGAGPLWTYTSADIQSGDLWRRLTGEHSLCCWHPGLQPEQQSRTWSTERKSACCRRV